MDELGMVLVRNLNELRHDHSEIEIFFIMEGSAQVTVKNQSYELEQEDIVVVNSGELHSVESSMNCIICDIHISCRKILELTGENTCIFECNSRIDITRSYSSIRTVMREVIYQYIKREPGKTDCLKISALYKLLDCLIENYRVESVIGKSGHKLDDNARVQQIYQYVNQNYQYGINMSELAEQLFLSTSTLSRVFKKETGIYFTDYVLHVRMNHAVDELLESEKSITTIALDCGFSNPSVFNRSFKELYGITPSEYRIQKKEKKRVQEEKKLQEQEKLRKELTEQLENQNINIAGRIKVSADVNQSRTFLKQWNTMLNIGSLDMLCRAAAQQQVLLLKKELGFQYARIWSIFSQKNMICTGKEGSGYNFSRLDYIFNFLIENDMIPFLDFGNRPDIAVGELDVNVFETHDYIAFESREAWEDCLSSLMEHLVERFGEEEIGRWRFEFSYDQRNEPVSNYYADSDYSYHNVFQHAWKTIKKFAPNAMVGGPMAMIDIGEQFVKEFLLNCREQKCIPDFVSLAIFPYRTKRVDGQIISEPATTDTVEMDFISRMQAVLLTTGCTNCKLFVTEWNNSVSNRNYLNDSNFRGTYIIHKMPDISESVDCVSLWMASDIISNYIDSNRLAYGGGGLLTQDGIAKPVFYALQFMNQLGERLISKGENYIITKKHETSFYVICYNFKWYNRRYFKKRELLDNPRDIEGVFENMDSVEIVIDLNHLPDNERFIITKRYVAAGYGNLLDEWKNFQYDEHLNADNIRYIRNASSPRMSMERTKVEKGNLNVSVTLQAHEFVLLHIHEDKRRIR